MRASDKAKVRHRRFAHVSLIIISFSLMFVGKADLVAMRDARMSSNDFLAPVIDFFSAPIRGVETMADGIRTVASLRAENVRLQAENDLLQRWRRRAEILESENQQLRSVTGTVSYETRSLITARAVTAPGGSFAHTLLIAIGDKEGIAAGDPVITSNGLVGIVYEVGRAYARVLMISDVNARIPVMLASSSWPGLSMGRNSEYLELEFLPAEARPAIGELVLTSGHGGILPAGLAVGRVERVDGDYVQVRPAVDFRNLGYVSILIGGTEGVDRSEFSQNDFFTPLPVEDDERLLKGLNASGRRQ